MVRATSIIWKLIQSTISWRYKFRDENFSRELKLIQLMKKLKDVSATEFNDIFAYVERDPDLYNRSDNHKTSPSKLWYFGRRVRSFPL